MSLIGTTRQFNGVVSNDAFGATSADTAASGYRLKRADSGRLGAPDETTKLDASAIQSRAGAHRA
jgi:hypothetical protein